MTLGDLSFEELKTLVNEPENRRRIDQRRIAIENCSVEFLAAKTKRGGVKLGELTDFYIQMHPSIHPGAYLQTLHLSPLIYALQRLPFEVATAEEVDVRKSRADDRGDAAHRIFAMNPESRRREMNRIGKNLEFVARDNKTDIFDLLSCMVMYSVEAEKVVRQLRNRSSLCEQLRAYTSNDHLKKAELTARLANALGVTYAELSDADNSLNGKLLPFFGYLGSSTKNPSEIHINFLEEFRQSDRVDTAGEWCDTIVKALKPYGDRPLAIISSDDHSVINLLSGHPLNEVSLLKAFASTQKDLTDPDVSPEGHLYYLWQKYLKTPQADRINLQKQSLDESLGIRFIKDCSATGINCQAIDLQKMFSNNHTYDPRLNIDPDRVRKSDLLMLVMDYPFGRQARHTMNNLCEQFGNRIQSTSILGKAAIVWPGGKKYDIMLPNEILTMVGEGDYRFNNELKASDIPGNFKGKVFENQPMLTVLGTAMQSDLVIAQYIVNYRAMGLEMEAFPYFDSIERQMGRHLNKDVKLLVGYWASDVPFDPKQSLAASHMRDGFIPLYALTVAALNKILKN